jgi:sulfur relay (sulfurtransferase) DsrF/TusC family protein
MPGKTVLIIVKSKPFSGLNYYEALRVAAGLWEHKVSLIWMGDGIYAALKNADTTLTSRFFEEFQGLNINLYVEEEALKKRGFGIEDVLPNAKVINRGKISELLLDAQASLVF